jgi:hypothetical protein
MLAGPFTNDYPLKQENFYCYFNNRLYLHRLFNMEKRSGNIISSSLIATTAIATTITTTTTR